MLASPQLDAARGARNPLSVAQAIHADETLEGILDQVLFVNEKNGYSVAVEWSAAGVRRLRRITVVGNLAGLEVGSTIRAHGGFEKHPRFGDQFRVVDFEMLRPAGVVAIERYLASEIKGVGPAARGESPSTSATAWARCSTTAPERLREVSRNRAAIARPIAAAWRDASGLRELTVFLRGHGIGGIACAAHSQVLWQGFARGGPPRSLRARAHDSRDRISYRRRRRRETRHPAQLDSARARRGPLPARADG